MRDIKERPTDRTPHVMDSVARAPKELARRSLLSAKEQAQETAAPQQRDESPTEYAESRVERTGEDVARRTGQEVTDRGKQLARKANDARKQYKEAKQRGTEQTRSSFHSESNVTRQGRERVRQTAQSSVGRSRLHSRPLSRAQKRLKQPQKARSRPRSAP